MKKYGIDRVNKHVLQRQYQIREENLYRYVSTQLKSVRDIHERAMDKYRAAEQIRKDHENATVIVKCTPGLERYHGERYQFVFSMDVDRLRFDLRENMAREGHAFSVGRYVYEAFRSAEKEFADIVTKKVQGDI